MPKTSKPAMKGRMIDFSDELWDAVKADADALGMSMGAFVRQAVSAALRPTGGLVTDSDDPADYPVNAWPAPRLLMPPLRFPNRDSLADRYVEAIKSSVEPPSPQRGNNGCPHPKASRRQLAYGTFCDNCQDMVR